MSKTTIPTGGLADDAVEATKLDLTANYAFTGNVSGAGGGKLLQVQSVDLTGTNTTVSAASFGATDVTDQITPSATSSKILVMMFKNQKYPEHYHVKKTETYLILQGDLEIKIKNKKVNLYQGDVYTVKKNTVHSFKTKKGVIFEEIATRYIKGDSKYLDKKIDKDRKTQINIFD